MKKIKLLLLKNLIIYNLVNKRKEYKLKKIKKKLITNRQIIFMADGKINHGGLCDRIWGMTSTFGYFHDLNHLDFKINFVSPTKLEYYLLPNLYDWRISEKEDFKLGSSCVDCENRVVVDSTEKNVLKTFKKILSLKVPIVLLYTNVHLFHDNFYKYFHTLFKPSQNLDININKHLKQIGVKYISISFRFRNAFGDFNENDSTSLKNEIKNKLIIDCKEIIKTIHKKNPNYHKIFVTCDSIIFKNEIANLDYVYQIQSPVSHIDYPQSYNIEQNLLNTFVDLFLLSKADKLFYIISKYTYHGSFAYTASKIGNKPYELIYLK